MADSRQQAAASQAAPGTAEAAPSVGAVALQESIQHLRSLKHPREIFAEQALDLIAKAARVDAAVLTACDSRASSVRILAAFGTKIETFRPLTSQSGRWIALRCLNEKRPNIVQNAEHNPFVPQNMVGDINPKGVLAIASLPFFHDNNTPAGAVVLFSSNPKHFNDALLYTLDQAVRACVSAVPEPAAAPVSAVPQSDPSLYQRRPNAPAPVPGLYQRTATPSSPPAVPPGDGGTAARLLQEERQRVQTLQKELSQLREVGERFPVLQQEVVRLNVQADEARAAADQARAHAASLEAARAEADARARAAAETLEALIASRDDLHSQLEESIALGRQRTQEMAQIEVEFQGLSEDRHKIEELRQAIIVSEGARVALEAQLNQVREQLTSAQAAHLETQSALQQRTDALNLAQQETQRVTARLAELEQTAQRLRAEQEDHSTARRQLEAAKTEARALQNALDAAQDTFAAKVREEAQKTTVFSERLRSLEEERNQAQQNLLRLKMDSHDPPPAVRAEADAMKRELVNLMQQLAELEPIRDERDELRSKLDELQNEIQPVQARGARTHIRGDEVAFEAAGIDVELLEAFSEEARESLEGCEQILMMLEQQPGDHQLISALFRRFHTLKGAAAAVGLNVAAGQLHEGESLLQILEESKRGADPAIVDFLLRLTDSIAGLISQALGKGQQHKIIRDIGAEMARLCVRATGPGTDDSRKDGADGESAVRQSDSDNSVLRVDVSSLDAMINKFSQLDVLRTIVTRELRNLSAVRDDLGDEKAGDGVDKIGSVIDALVDVSNQFSVLRTSLQKQVTQLRLVPLDSVFRRLQRAVRDAAHRAGKLVDFEVAGGDVYVDRTILEGLHASLIHIVRNSVAHGIETPDVREQRDKSPKGTVRVEAVHKLGAVDAHIEVSVTDDGGGMNYDAILAKGRERGLIAPNANPTKKELIALIFEPGFSTGVGVTELAGRGVGMDVVARELAAMGGKIDIDSDPCGTCVRLILPTSTVVS